MKHIFQWFVALVSLFAAMVANPVSAQNFFSQSDLQWVAVPDHADWLYKVGEKPEIGLQLLWHGQPLPGVEVSYAIGQDELADETSGKVVTDAKGCAVIRMSSAKKPSFRDCRMTCAVEGKSFMNHIKVGFSADEIQPYTQMPSDVREFWDGVLDRQKQLPMEVTVADAP